MKLRRKEQNQNQEQTQNQNLRFELLDLSQPVPPLSFPLKPSLASSLNT